MGESARRPSRHLIDVFIGSPAFIPLFHIFIKIFISIFFLSLVCSILRMRGPGVDTQFLTGPFALLNKKLEIRPFHASIPSADT